MHNYGFIVNYRYLASNKIIIASPNRTGDAINFFTGQWFERFVYLKIAQLLTQHELNYQCLINSEIITREGLNFELDIVFLIDEKPVWIECKTGQYQSYIHKYSQFRSSLDIGKDRSFLVILGINDKLCQELTKMYDLTVTNERLFVRDIGKILVAEEELKLEETPVELKSDRRTIRITTGTIRDEYDLIKALKKLKLRPAPEWRSIVFVELIKIVSHNSYNPTRFKDIRETLFLNVTGISKTILIDILNTLIMAECLIDSTGQSLYSYNQSLSSLVSNRVDALEQKCLEVYALVVWLIDPEFLTSLSNLEVLKKATGVDNLNCLNLAKIEEMTDEINDSQNIISTVKFAFDDSLTK